MVGKLPTQNVTPINWGRRKKNLVKMTADPNATKSWDKRSFPAAKRFFLSRLGERICTLFISLVHPQNLVFIQRHNHPFFLFSGLAKARKLIANIVLTCLWEKLEKKSLFLALASRGSGFERNEMGRGGMSLLPHNCPLFLQHLSGRLQSCDLRESWKDYKRETETIGGKAIRI